MHYWANKFFAPVHVSGYIKSGNILQIFVIRDDLNPAETYTLNVLFFKWSSLEIAFTKLYHIKLVSMVFF